MWKSSEYCDFTCNWHCDHDPNFLSSYNLIQNSEKQDWNVELTEVGSENVLTYTPIMCQRNDNVETLEVTSNCKTHHSVSIIGFNILSEARTVELYSEVDGYLLTVKGQKLVIDKSINEGIELPVLYCCKAKLDESIDSVILKFLGVNGKQCVKIYRLHFFLNQNNIKSNTIQNGPGMIDMEKVKGYLHSMGDSAPENGTKLMHAVEDFQQSQMSRFGGLQSLSSGNGNNLGLLTSLLSMANRPSKEKENKHNPTNSSKQNGENSEMPTPPGSGALSAMLMSMSGSQNDCHGDSSGQGQMFAMLQSICGKVGKMRVKEQPSPENTTVDNKDDNEVKGLDASQGKDGSLGEAGDCVQIGAGVNMTRKMIEQTVSQMIETREQKLKEYIDTSLSAMESRLSHKLDKLIEMLQKDQDQPNANSDDPL